jgi:hypothetical protein
MVWLLLAELLSASVEGDGRRIAELTGSRGHHRQGDGRGRRTAIAPDVDGMVDPLW